MTCCADTLDVWRHRRLDHDAFEHLFIDLTRLRVESRGPVSRGGVLTAIGVTSAGELEVLGVEVGDTESRAFWRSFLGDLRARGLHGVARVVCEHHDGLGPAIADVFPDATYHLMSVDEAASRAD